MWVYLRSRPSQCTLPLPSVPTLHRRRLEPATPALDLPPPPPTPPHVRDALRRRAERIALVAARAAAPALRPHRHQHQHQPHTLHAAAAGAGREVMAAPATNVLPDPVLGGGVDVDMVQGDAAAAEGRVADALGAVAHPRASGSAVGCVPAPPAPAAAGDQGATAAAASAAPPRAGAAARGGVERAAAAPSGLPGGGCWALPRTAAAFGAWGHGRPSVAAQHAVRWVGGLRVERGAGEGGARAAGPACGSHPVASHQRHAQCCLRCGVGARRHGRAPPIRVRATTKDRITPVCGTSH
jgi:hypothetical protein